MRIAGIIQTLLLASFTMLISVQANAQEGKCPGWGTGPDSLKNVQNFSLYSEFYNQKNYKDAYHPWQMTLKNSPGSSKNVYIKGSKILKAMIKEEQDSARREMLIDSLLFVFDKRIECYGDEGKVLGLKANEMHKFKRGTVKEQFDVLSKSVELTGDKTSYQLVYLWFIKGYMSYKKKFISKEDALNVYLRGMEVLNMNIEDEKKKAKVEDQIQKMSSLLLKLEISCEEATAIFGPKYKANPDDEKLWSMIFETYRGSGCTKDSIFMDVTKKLHAKKPTASKAIFIARNIEDPNEATTFFKQGMDLEEDSEKKATYTMELASHLKSKLSAFSESRKYALEAAKLKPKWGEPYILIGDLYAASGKLCGKGKDTGFWAQTVTLAALDKYNYAKSIDPECHEKANKKINFYSQYLPCTGDAFMIGINDGESITIDWCWINETTTLRTSKCN